ncbi:MAG: HupE/UreJ family protein [Myxococcota bacterium]
MAHLIAAIILAFLAFADRSANAHEVRPAYLELSALGEGAWDLLWKVPAKGDLRFGLHVRLPASCEVTDPLAHASRGAHVERWRALCPGGLVGETISIDGLAATRTDVLVRVHHDDGSTQTVRLTPGDPAFAVERAPGALAVARTYLMLGTEHILLGADHLLFVLALLLLAGGARLVGAVTAFTVAHSLTLVAAVLGWLHVPAAPVEASIALSIVFVAAEVLHAGEGLARRKPWTVAFAVGLLHGLGFAGALSEVGLPDHAIPLALACFNLGVELGQLLFIAAVLALVVLPSLLTPTKGARPIARQLHRPAAYTIGTLGAFWLIDRTLSFWQP